jgi:hypothetical protein
MKRKVFISHIALEADLAILLKQWIETAFGGGVDVFVSSSPEVQVLGIWLQALKNHLSEAQVLLVLASQVSVGSTWVFFETGFATAKEVDIIPICLQGQLPGRLPPPLSHYQALQVIDQHFGSKLVRELKRILSPTLRRGGQLRAVEAGDQEIREAMGAQGQAAQRDQ